MDEAAQVKEFLDAMRSFSAPIPEELIDHYLQQAGFSTTDPKILRLVALAAHKFIVDITHDAMQYQRIRAQNPSSVAANAGNAGSGLMSGPPTSGNRAVLTMEDLAASLKEYGVNMIKPEYVVDVAMDGKAQTQ